METEWKTCPRCSSKRVSETGKVQVFFILLASGGCLFWVGLLFIPILVIAIFLIVVAPVILFSSHKTYQCGDCKKTWNEKKKANDRAY